MTKTFSLITGASSGIGLEIAKELASRGNNLVLTARREKKLIKLKNEIISKFNVECDFICVDLSEINSTTKIFNYCNQNRYFINKSWDTRLYKLARY